MGRILVITGTDTGVGKTIVSAAVCRSAQLSRRTVAYLKAAQTGVEPGQPGDVDVVLRLGMPEVAMEGARYALPLAPGAAIRLGAPSSSSMEDVAALTRHFATSTDLVVLEGAGGLLVGLDEEGTTIADLAQQLDADVIVVTRASLGTLNHTALTFESMARRDCRTPVAVIGRWPSHPDLACLSNVRELERIVGRQLAGAIPEGAGDLDPREFGRCAPSWVAPALGGVFDAGYFGLHGTLAPIPHRKDAQ